MNNDHSMLLGFDIGSVSVNTVVMDHDGNIQYTSYHYCHGRPFQVLLHALREVLSRNPDRGVDRVALTGTGGNLAAELLGGAYVNEMVAQAASVSRLHPRARTIIEMGGEDSKLIFLERRDGTARLRDFAMNTICAAGTGSFLDQQARRIGVSIEGEFGELALRSQDPPRIAGRCSVFAKSDMIHLQQIATPVHDIVAGLCFAVARNYKSSLAQGKELAAPVVFQGGVAANAGMVRAFREVFCLGDGDLAVPRHHACMGAIGALYHLLESGSGEDGPGNREHGFPGTRLLEEHLENGRRGACEHLEPLADPGPVAGKPVILPVSAPQSDVYLGLDVGSLSTNLVLIDRRGNVVARRYLPTAGKPLEAIRGGLAEIREEVGDRVRVRAAGATGSGRYLTGDFVGADVITNEITAQATAAVAIDPEVDTVFEIGGQDSKFISIDHGVVVDFEMNKVCAAGTGSFLEEQAEKLDIDIRDFGDIALAAGAPSRLGDRCTVFMESDLNSHQQRGVPRENLVSGLAYSIVYNYIQKVVGTKRIGSRILFQGGVANNRSVVAAFRKVTGKPIVVPPHFDVTGAIGAAMLARDRVQAGGGPGAAAAKSGESRSETRFKGFDISERSYSVDRFTCGSCSNHCEIRRVRIEGERRPLCYGGRCERYETDDRRGGGEDLPDLFKERMDLLLGDFRDTPAAGREGRGGETRDAGGPGAGVIGIPRALMAFHQQFPYWRTFFETLGFRVVLSRPTSRELVARSLERLQAETCFPNEVMIGHVHDLLDRGAHFLFLPSVINAPAGRENPTKNYNCPWIQTVPFMVRASLTGTGHEDRLLIPVLHMRYPRLMRRQLSSFMKKRFGVSRSATAGAVREAERAQERFRSAVEKRGREVLDSLPPGGTSPGKKVLVILGRPYNTQDPELNLHLAEKLRGMDVLPVPMDFLPLSGEDVYRDYPMMYWPNGRNILAACRIVARDDRLHAVYLSNFRCGPDSFLTHFAAQEMKGKPFLQLEMDEHSADAGLVTRCEAYLESLRSREALARGSGLQSTGEERSGKARPVKAPSAGRTMYVPYMSDHVRMLAAASRHCGMKAGVLPPVDEKAVELGRRHTSSRECFPMICTTGSFLQKILEPGFQPESASFFMPDHNGPCRFGQYNRLQRIIFDRLGYGDVAIVSPSNDDAYAELSGGHGTRFRLCAWKGLVAVDMLRKLLHERRPYEADPGQCDRVYAEYLSRLEQAVERGARDVGAVLAEAVDAFEVVVPGGGRRPGETLPGGARKPVISVTGEIFMRDNPSANGRIVQRLERLGAEVLITPVREWITYSTYRYGRDSRWEGNLKGLLQSRVQQLFQRSIEKRLVDVAREHVDIRRDIHLGRCLDLCEPYVTRHYDGQPALVLGGSSGQAAAGISGVVNILPFTCMPETFTAAVTPLFRKNHRDIPWVNIAYDGQEDTGIDTRLQAFMHQVRDYARRHGLCGG